MSFVAHGPLVVFSDGRSLKIENENNSTKIAGVIYMGLGFLELSLERLWLPGRTDVHTNRELTDKPITIVPSTTSGYNKNLEHEESSRVYRQACACAVLAVLACLRSG